MKKVKLFGLMLFSSLVSLACADFAEDIALRDTLRLVFGDVHAVSREVDRILGDIGFETNRLVSAAKALYFDSADERVQGRAMSIVARYGGVDDVTFLESCATNQVHWRSAAVGVLNMMGLTTNALSRISVLMQNRSEMGDVATGNFDRGFVVEQVLRRAKSDDVSPSDKAMAFGFAVNIASNETGLVEATDSVLINFDPSYRISHRRLNVLRFQQKHVSNEFQANYIASAIRILEAYPEANLPE